MADASASVTQQQWLRCLRCHRIYPQSVFRKPGRHAAFHDICRSCRRLTSVQERQRLVTSPPPQAPSHHAPLPEVTASPLHAAAVPNGRQLEEPTIFASPADDGSKPMGIIPTLVPSNDVELEDTQHHDLAASAETLFRAKAAKKLSFEQIAQHIGRNEVAVAAIFYGQAKASAEDIQKLSSLFNIPRDVLEHQLGGFPDRGRDVPMPPKEPLIYRLYEIVLNYGYAYKAILNEKLGDGIMSAISFSTTVEKETDKDGNKWAVITLRGKWLPYSRF